MPRSRTIWCSCCCPGDLLRCYTTGSRFNSPRCLAIPVAVVLLHVGWVLPHVVDYPVIPAQLTIPTLVTFVVPRCYIRWWLFGTRLFGHYACRVTLHTLPTLFTLGPLQTLRTVQLDLIEFIYVVRYTVTTTLHLHYICDSRIARTVPFTMVVRPTLPVVHVYRTLSAIFVTFPV